MEALQRANEVRLWLAEQKREIAGGDLERWHHLCLNADVRLKSVGLLEFVTWVPGIGEVAGKKLVRRAVHWPTDRTYFRSMATIDFTLAIRLSNEVTTYIEDKAMRRALLVAA